MADIIRTERDITLEDGTRVHVTEVRPVPDPVREQARERRLEREPALESAYVAALEAGDEEAAARVRGEVATLSLDEYPRNGLFLAQMTLQSWEDAWEVRRSGATERCPGCGCPRAEVIEDTGFSQVRHCERCDGLYGTVTPFLLRRYVAGGWCNDSQAVRQYVDFVVLLPGGERRRQHGWVSARDRTWIQVG